MGGWEGGIDLVLVVQLLTVRNLGTRHGSGSVDMHAKIPRLWFHDESPPAALTLHPYTDKTSKIYAACRYILPVLLRKMVSGGTTVPWDLDREAV